MINHEIAKIFRDLALLLEMKGVQFKPRAFEKAAFSIDSMSDDLKEIYEKGGVKSLEEIPGIGAGMAERIEEYIKTGKIGDYEKLRKEVPVNLDDLASIEGVGPKMILKLYKKLHIKDREELEKAIAAGKLRHVKGFGEKTEQNLLKNISFLKNTVGRLGIADALPYAREIIKQLEKTEGIKKIQVAGSLRRMQETIGDIDLLAISDKPEKIIQFFVSMPGVEAIHAQGDTKASVRLSIGIDADLRVLPPESFGAAVQYFSGDKFHNIALRQIAIKHGYKLNEYGLFKGEKLIAGKSEENIYEKLGLQWIEPEMRTNHGEIEVAMEHKLPKLISYDDIRGDLQVHTNWTDGKFSIKEMAEAAKKYGHKYIAISDHTKSLAMTNGMDEKRLLEQMDEIDRVQKEIDDFKILKGAEVNIMKDGTLDIEDKVLAKLDVVGAAIHSNFNMSEEDMTKRIIRAMENPNIDIIYHPTGRIISRREGYKIDIDEIIRVAKRTGTILEIDGWPDRLDLNDEHARKVIAAGVKISIDTDSHHTGHFRYMEYGIGMARRAWATADDVINTRSWGELLKLLK